MSTRTDKGLELTHKDPHFDCLTVASIVLNRYQDIEDIIAENIPDKAKLKKIKKVNAEIGRVVAKYLPG